MKSRFCTYLIVISITIILIWAVYLFIVVRTDYNDEMPRSPFMKSSSFDLTNHLLGLNEGNLKQKFPYQVYLDSADWNNYHSIIGDLGKVNSICQNSVLNQQILWIALTEQLEKYKEKELKTYNPNELIILLNWAVKFKHYAEIDTSNAMLFQSVHEHWLDLISGRLRYYYAEDPSVKYEFKFKHLVSQCEENNFNPGIGTNNNYNKAINHILISNWSYLINRFWIATTWYFKMLAFTLMGITVYGYFCIFRFHFNK